MRQLTIPTRKFISPGGQCVVVVTSVVDATIGADVDIDYHQVRLVSIVGHKNVAFHGSMMETSFSKVV